MTNMASNAGGSGGGYSASNTPETMSPRVTAKRVSNATLPPGGGLTRSTGVAATSVAPPTFTTRNTEVPATIKLLSEMERSWSMFSATWKVVDLFAGMQIWQEQASEAPASEPLNGLFFSTTSAGVVAFLAASIGGGGVVVAVLLSAAVVFGTLWTMTSARARGDVPSFKVLKTVDGSPSEVFLYLMNIKNYAVYVYLCTSQWVGLWLLLTILSACGSVDGMLLLNVPM
jgi:hypothetical protein